MTDLFDDEELGEWASAIWAGVEYAGGRGGRLALREFLEEAKNRDY